MHAFQGRLMRIVALASAIASIATTAQADGPSAIAGRVSRQMSDAILTEFRNVDIQPRPIVEEILFEADPDVVVLPELLVRERFDVGPLNSDKLTPPTGSIPLKLGTGITEYHGKEVSVLTQRILFIPLGFKLAW